MMTCQTGRANGASVLIRCDGGSEMGLGHIVRCLALAEELREKHGSRVQFLIRGQPVAIQMAEKAGFSVLGPANAHEKDRDWISRVLSDQQPEVLVMDFRAGLDADAVRKWRRQGVLTVSVDDPEDKRIACDLVFSPPVPQVRRADWRGFTGELLIGWEWVLLRRQFAVVSANPETHLRPVVLVTMGGSDPAGLTLKAIEALDSLDAEFDTMVVVGGAFCHNETLDKMLSEARRRFEVRRDVSNMSAVMAQADLAIASFCVTAYELAVVGVPGIYLCLTEDHAESATAFTENGMGISLGVHTRVTAGEIATTARRLICDQTTRKQLSQACRRLACGSGAANIAERIIMTLEKTHAGK